MVGGAAGSYLGAEGALELPGLGVSFISSFCTALFCSWQSQSKEQSGCKGELLPCLCFSGKILFVVEMEGAVG